MGAGTVRVTSTVYTYRLLDYHLRTGRQNNTTSTHGACRVCTTLTSLKEMQERMPTHFDSPGERDRLADTELINVDGFFSLVKRLFSGKATHVVGELLQNAQRASATQVTVTTERATPEQGGAINTSSRYQPHEEWRDDAAQHGQITALIYYDDGAGLSGGPAGMLALLQVAGSYYANPHVAEQQEPMGIGFYALLAYPGITAIRVRSNDVALAIDVAAWWNDSAYRRNWLAQLHETHDLLAWEPGFTLRIEGTGEALFALVEALRGSPVRMRPVDPKNHERSIPDMHTTPDAAEGYAGILAITLDGAPVETAVRPGWSLAGNLAQITTTYAGAPLRIHLKWREDRWNWLVVRWYGQLIVCDNLLPYGLTAYLDVTEGRPVTPRAPVREGLVADEKLAALRAWIIDQVFTYLAALPLADWHPHLLALAARLDAVRAAQLPVAAVTPWLPLPDDPCSCDYSDGPYDADQTQGEPLVVARAQLPHLQLLAGTVAVDWGAEGRPAQRGQHERITEESFGLASFVRSLGLVAYAPGHNCADAPSWQLWWRPERGLGSDRWHASGLGQWALGPVGATTPPPAEQWQAVPNVAPDGTPAALYVVSECDTYDIEETDLFFAAAAPYDRPERFLQRYGRVALRWNEDYEGDQEDDWDTNLDAMVRKHYRPRAVRANPTLRELEDAFATHGSQSGAPHGERLATVRIVAPAAATVGNEPPPQQQSDVVEHPIPSNLELIGERGTVIRVERYGA